MSVQHVHMSNSQTTHNVFEHYERVVPSPDTLRRNTFKGLCALSNSREVRTVVHAFLKGCCCSPPSRSRSTETPMPQDCALVYLIALRVAFFPNNVFKRSHGVEETELGGCARRLIAGVSDLIAEAKRGGWVGFHDVAPAVRAATASLFFEYLWPYLEFVERRRVIERRRTLSALCVVHNARLASPGNPKVRARCAKGLAALMPCFAKVKLPADEEVYHQIRTMSSAPIPGYPGDPALPIRAYAGYCGDKPLGLGRLAYELLVDPAYRSLVVPDYLDLFDECAFFTLERDLGDTPPAVDGLQDMLDSISKSVQEMRPGHAPLPSEGALLGAFEARGSLACLLQPLFDALADMSTPPSFFAPAPTMTPSEHVFVRMADCGGEPLPLHAAFVDRLSSLRSEWLQFTHPFPEPLFPCEVANIWARTLRYLMWMRASLDVESSDVRIGFLRPVRAFL